MSFDFSLTPANPAKRSQLAAREQQLEDRISELTSLQHDLQSLQSRYFEKVGTFYAQLIALDAAIAEAEIRAGLRPPPGDDGFDARDEEADAPPESCTNRGAPTDDLKRMFRDLAKVIHPDLAGDDSARYRRHSLMAEANRAYAERDGDRLRLIMRAWERSPDSLVAGDERGDGTHIDRQIASVEAQLLAIDVQFDDLRKSAIYRLKTKIDDASRQGWDLLAEMVLHVKREISTSNARLASLRRTSPMPERGGASAK